MEEEDKRPSAATGKYTDFDATQLSESMARFEGVCVLSTVNEDGTPNAAIFVPFMVDEEHAVFVLAANRTRENVERTGRAWAVYDVANPGAKEKKDRHAGARLRLSLVRESEFPEEFQRVAEAYPRMNPHALIFRIEEIVSIG